MRLRIPKYENIEAVNYEYLDQCVNQYYKPLLRTAMRKRLKMALKLLGDNKVDKILDAGYGGGTFLLELSARCNNLYGIDIHSEEETVQAMLSQEGVSASLSQTSILHIPYPEAFFDQVVCMSVLEHLVGEELRRAIEEMGRALKDRGRCIIGFPVKNRLTDFIIARILRFRPDEIHPTNHTLILERLKERFVLERLIHYPSFLPLNYSLYAVCQMKKRG